LNAASAALGGITAEVTGNEVVFRGAIQPHVHRGEGPPLLIDYADGTTHNDTTISSREGTNLRQIGGARGQTALITVPPADPPGGITATGAFNFSVREYYDTDTIYELLERQTHLRLNLLSGTSVDIYFNYVTGEGFSRPDNRINIWEGMTSAQMMDEIQAAITAALDAVPNSTASVTRAAASAPSGGRYPFTLDISMDFTEPPTLTGSISLQERIIAVDTREQIPGPDRVTHPGNATVPALLGLNVSPPIPNGAHPGPERYYTVTFTLPDDIAPGAIQIGTRTIVIFDSSDTTLLPDGATIAPPSPTTLHVDLATAGNPHTAVLNAIESAARLNGWEQSFAAGSQISNVAIDGNTISFSGWGNQTLPAELLSSGGVPWSLAFTYTETIVDPPPIDNPNFGVPTPMPATAPDIRYGLGTENLDLIRTRHLAQDVQLPMNGAAINFSRLDGLIGTGFMFGGVEFEFYDPSDIYPRISAPPTQLIAIDTSAIPAPDASDVAAAMQQAMNPSGDTGITVSANSDGLVTINHTSTSTPSPTLSVPPTVQFRNGNWDFDGIFGAIPLKTMTDGMLAEWPGVRINFADIDPLELIPDTDGEYERVRGFTLRCASCPDEFFTIIFLNEEHDTIPEFEDGRRIIPVILGVQAIEGVVRFDTIAMIDRIVETLSHPDYRVHFTDVSRVGTELVIRDVRRGNLPGAIQGDFPLGGGNRGQLETYTLSAIYRQSEIDIFAPRGLWIQNGANAMQGVTVYIDAMNAMALGLADVRGHSAINVVRDSGVDVSPLLSVLDEAMTHVTVQRADLGAMLNRLEHTANSLGVSVENLSDAESRIRNADMAREMMTFTMQNILMQAGTSMLSQANQLPNTILELLR
jgi:flagellin-like hook-associated protein FlgL